MKLSNRQIVSAIEPLNQLNAEKLPVKTAFRVAKISKSLNSALEDYNQTLDKIREHHLEKDENDEFKVQKSEREGEPDRYILKDPDKFQSDLDELLNLEVEVKLEKLKLKHIENLELQPSVFYHLDWLFEE